MPPVVTPDELMTKLRQLIAEHGSQSAVAKKLDMTQSHLSDILSGKRNLSESVASAMGYKLVYVKKEDIRET